MSLIDPKGSETLALDDGQFYYWIRYSPDGNRLALGTRDEGGVFKISIFEIQRGVVSQLIFEGNARCPIWSPDGETIAFSADDGI